MSATLHQDTAAVGRRRTLRALAAHLLDRLCAERQKAVSRRLAEELPEHLLRDMGIGRARLRQPLPAETAAVLRDAGGWR